MKNNPQISTVGKTSFGSYNAENASLFSIKAGVSIEEALEQASCLLGCVRDLTVIDTMDGDAGVRVWSAHYLGEMAKAIIDDVATSLNHLRARP